MSRVGTLKIKLNIHIYPCDASCDVEQEMLCTEKYTHIIHYIWHKN